MYIYIDFYLYIQICLCLNTYLQIYTNIFISFIMYIHIHMCTQKHNITAKNKAAPRLKVVESFQAWYTLVFFFV